jgi:hypothetical protein
MDAHLVRTAGLQPAFDERVLAHFLQDSNMRDRELTITGSGAAAAPPITPVTD